MKTRKTEKKFSVSARKVVFSKGPIHLVDCTVTMAGGRVLSRQVIEHPGAAVIIPQISENRYILIRQFRFAARDWLWEFPAGGIEPGEAIAASARRELAEETGYGAKKLKKLVEFYSSPGMSGEIMYLFLASGLYKYSLACDEDEVIEQREFSMAEMARMIRRGTIRDAKTLLGYFYLKDIHSA